MVTPRRRGRIWFGLLGGVVGFLLVYQAAAATISALNDNLGAGNAVVAECDTNGFVIDGFMLNGNAEITHIDISGIDTLCVGGALSVSLTKADDTSIGSGGPVTVTGASMSVPITGLPPAADVKHEVIIIVGP